MADEKMRWPIDDALRAKALGVITDAMDGDDKRLATTAAKLIADTDSLNLRDEEFRDKTARLDAGTPTEISDQATLGAAVADLADRLGGIIGDRAGADTRPVTVVESVEGPARQIEGRTESSEPDAETA